MISISDVMDQQASISKIISLMSALAFNYIPTGYPTTGCTGPELTSITLSNCLERDIINSVEMGLSYNFPIDLRRLSQCTPRHLWRALAAAGSIWAWS